MKSLLFVFIFLSAWAVSCDPVVDNEGFVGNINAYTPVYAQLTDIQDISMEGAKPTVKAGKIYVYGNYIFQNDLNKGIHIIDNSVPSNPHKIAFLKIPYSTELAVKGNYLYTNSVSDLVVLDLQDPQHPTVVKRIKDAFPIIDQQHPPVGNTYFVCADPKKGIVVDWIIQNVENPACRR